MISNHMQSKVEQTTQDYEYMYKHIHLYILTQSSECMCKCTQKYVIMLFPCMLSVYLCPFPHLYCATKTVLLAVPAAIMHEYTPLHIQNPPPGPFCPHLHAKHALAHMFTNV
jgi:hypothetical protein